MKLKSVGSAAPLARPTPKKKAEAPAPKSRASESTRTTGWQASPRPHPSKAGGAGTVTTLPSGKKDLVDPRLHKDDVTAGGKPKHVTERFSGPLFKDGPSMEDVQQGYLADCYFPSAIASIANVDASVFPKIMKDNGDGTYSVTFQKRDRSTGKLTPETVKVDGDLYIGKDGGPFYGRSAGDKAPQSMELWFPLLEKAYAVWKGGAKGYDAVGSGGFSSDVFQAILGKKGVAKTITTDNGDAIFADIQKQLAKHLPVSAGTYGDAFHARFTNTGVYADHSYSVVGTKEEGGVKYVEVRNPWGDSEPGGASPADGKNDGVFYLPLSQFTKQFETYMTVAPN
jgi:hypothetical protein